MKLATYLSSALILFSCGYVSVASAAQANQSQAISQKASQYTDRIIVKMKESVSVSSSSRSMSAVGNSGLVILSHAAIKSMADDSGESLSYVRAMRGSSGHVMKLNRMASLEEVNVIAAAIAKENDAVEYAEADARVFPLATPNDEFYAARQWNLQSSADQGLNLPDAWDHTTGSSSVVVAVLDTGILRDHADFDLNRILNGADLVSADNDGQFLRSNDGGGRDTDPTDPGDWLDAADLAETEFSDPACQVMDSTWHGTHVAGIIGAASNDNGSGVAGVDWNAKILPVRVLGKCGGYTSDIADGIYWAAGISVTGVADNLTPAHVINLSLGRVDTCSVTEQNAITAARAQGSVIVIAAGNESGAVNAPGNCTGVIAVAAHDKNGVKTSYSNIGSTVDIMAPGGESSATCDDTHESIYSLGDGGLTAALNDDAYVCLNGTSMAAPHISGLAALILARNPDLTPDQVEAAIKSSARTFVDGGTCTLTTCGAGIADAAAAIVATAIPIIPSGFSNTDVDLNIKFDWVDNSQLETGFTIERSVDAAAYEVLATVAPDITTYTDEDVKDGATSIYRLAGINGVYSSAYTDVITVTKDLNPPTTLAVDEFTTSAITLSWVDASNNESGYQVNRSSNGSDESPVYKRLAVLAVDATSYVDSNVVDGQEYYYKVLTLGATANSEFTEAVSARTPINTPTFLQGESTANQIEVSWTDNSESETGFQIERSLDGVTYAQIATVAMDETSYVDKTVSASAFYYYRVRAYTESTNSEYSTIASLSTPSDTKGAGNINPYLLVLLLLTLVRVRSNNKR
ncbi:MAG: S8 family serine peptidase [Bermanella sp.]